MRYWEPHWSYAVRVDCAHLQAENDALHDRLQQCHDHAAKAQPHKCWLSCARSTATLSSQALREDEGVAATSRAAPILSVDFGKSDPPSPLGTLRARYCCVTGDECDRLGARTSFFGVRLGCDNKLISEQAARSESPFVRLHMHKLGERGGAELRLALS